jgi:hypothetical protein
MRSAITKSSTLHPSGLLTASPKWRRIFFQVPMAGVSLVDEDRVWFKSRVGIDLDETARDAGLCSSAMLSQGIYHLNDAAHDERALGHSFVTDLGIRFYAAAPPRTREGFDLGTVWVLDQKPREMAAG